MGKCVNHPDRETSYMCSKHGTYQCGECLECRDPDIYCKFRSACPIWYEHKRKARQARQRAGLEENGKPKEPTDAITIDVSSAV
jgi:hypothetical protein